MPGDPHSSIDRNTTACHGEHRGHRGDLEFAEKGSGESCSVKEGFSTAIIYSMDSFKLNFIAASSFQWSKSFHFSPKVNKPEDGSHNLTVANVLTNSDQNLPTSLGVSFSQVHTN